MIFFKILFYCQLQAVTTADEEHNSIKIKSFILIFKHKVYKKSSKISNKWILRRFFVYTLIKNKYYAVLKFIGENFRCFFYTVQQISNSQHPQRSILIYRKGEMINNVF